MMLVFQYINFKYLTLFKVRVHGGYPDVFRERLIQSYIDDYN